ncbi:precorrin-2 dehydrogenase/sirohydrochlorin ferrochelatase family protein [Phyllobacterium lublinensis]|uniref:precorrin-2 dehydrogenase/sirohydrochlorin ferrochelatase family protein n=1 Tax=Phyllobacterium lublinensis TaxID=2875708 RepID=UPI001CC9A094|nr:NAD(P)-dependent oxidoreductase [Phyllobacterium sp. 2063]MBZ9653672.1 siroheme synthase [Phyllobacterium sp. 2063]
MQILSKLQSSPASSIGSLAVLPVFFNLSGKRALVAGGSAPAAWKAELLAAAGAEVHVYARTLSEEMAAVIGSMSLIQHRSAWNNGSFDGATIAVADVPTDDEARDFLEAAIKAGVPCNIIDRPGFCQFQFGSIVNRSPVVIGISTDGAAPILGQAIRRRLEALLPASLAQWAHLAKSVRGRVGELLKPGPQRRRFWEGFVDRVFASAEVPSEQSLLGSAHEIADAELTVTRSLIHVESDDPEMLTLKSVRAMQMADVILFDPGVAPAILELGRREAKRLCVSNGLRDRMSRTFHNKGKHVVVLSGARDSFTP